MSSPLINNVDIVGACLPKTHMLSYVARKVKHEVGRELGSRIIVIQREILMVNAHLASFRAARHTD